jgi:hypothetical protein
LPISASVWRSASLRWSRPLHLIAPEAIFSHTIRMAEEEFFVDEA